VESLLQEQIAYYRARAGEYDDFWFRRGQHALPDDLKAMWDADAAETEAWLRSMSPGGEVLEIACGTGLFTRHLLDGASSVTVVDSSTEMLKAHRHRLPDPRISRQVVDVFTWTPPRSTYDVAVFTYWLSHVPTEEFAAFWGRVATALKPGGLALFVDSAPYPDTLAERESVAEPRRLDDGRTFSVVKRYWRPRELTSALDRLGWEAEVTTTTHEMILCGRAHLRR
jgi:SAM-dependent methyltransferase